MRRLQVLAAAGVFAAMISGPALAAGGVSDRDPSSDRVEVAAVDFRDAGQVQALYKRLQQASLFVCGVQTGVDSVRRGEDRACSEKALREAVESVNRPLLTATYQQSGAPMLARGY